MKETVDAYSESDILACVPHLSDKLKIAIVGYGWVTGLAGGVPIYRVASAIMAVLPIVKKTNLFGSGAQKRCVYMTNR